jgi:molybdate transport system regulatory protein
LRVQYGEEIALGPGKIDLLALIEKTGSIRQAAESMGMSYMRAWKLIQTMNDCFNHPLVEAVRGGPAHGGAVLTETGRRALRCYHAMEAEAMKATKPGWRDMQALLRD